MLYNAKRYSKYLQVQYLSHIFQSGQNCKAWIQTGYRKNNEGFDLMEIKKVSCCFKIQSKLIAPVKCKAKIIGDVDVR